MLGTLVELGVVLPDAGAEPRRCYMTALEAGWRALARVEATMSAFLPESDVARFNSAPAGARLEVHAETIEVLRAAAALQWRTGGLFDVTQGTGPEEWSLMGTYLVKRTSGVRIDVGGIAKGHAVDLAAEAVAAELRRMGAAASCWVNAGGDLAVQGVEVPIHLRDERSGGARPWLAMREGAVATSHFGASPGRLTGGPVRAWHVTVAAPRCLDCDALTKVVGLTGRADHPAVLERRGRAWIHA